jgi:cysteinyl-tRNA synthetase
MSLMNVLPPNGYTSPTYHDTYARATEFIAAQIDMVGRLIEQGFAYQTEQAIYFEVAKLPDYGMLSGQKLADKEVAVRSEVITDAQKRSPHDFAVWFFAVGSFADHSMQWESPWGAGFPGWHLECSAIIHATLGDPIDIHTGGVDPLGTHHPNEMAQTQAAYGHELSRFWVHNEFMLVDGAKMSKSKGNSYTLAELTSRGFSPLSYRLLCLQAHYRSELNFTWDSLEAAQNTLLNLYGWADLKHQTDLAEVRLSDTNISDFIGRVEGALSDDLAATAALAEVFAYSTSLAPGMTLPLEDFDEILGHLDELLGLGLSNRPDITTAQKELIAQRQTAREARDWPGADKLRSALLKTGLEISDTPNGARWRRTTLS